MAKEQRKRRVKPAARPLKMDDIAAKAGVSKSTVSRALSDSPLVNEQTKRHIRAIARSHNYTINQHARNFRLKQTNTISVLMPLMHEASQHISDPFFLDLLGRVADELSESGYDLLLTKVGVDHDDWLDEIIEAGRSDGLILLGQSTQHEAINRAAQRFSPLVVWGARLPGQAYCSVGSDNVEGGRLATAHLLSLGRRSIAFLGDRNLPEIGQRYQGYVRALRAHGLEPDPALSVAAHFGGMSAYDAARKLLEAGDAFDGVVAASDVIAMSAIKALQESGIGVPEDVAVTGFDDVTLAAYYNPALTTVRQDTPGAAKRLVAKLIALIGGDRAASEELPVTLIARASSGATKTK